MKIEKGEEEVQKEGKGREEGGERWSGEKKGCEGKRVLNYS